MPRRYVLVVEDNPDICALLGRMLAAYEAEILVALQIDDAIEKSKNFPVHLALIDVILENEEKRGLEIVGALRKEGLRAPLYIMTGVPAKDIPEDVKTLTDGVLAKPFAYSELRSLLEKHLGATTSISRQATMLRDILGVMTSVATEQEEIRRQQGRLSSFMMVLQRNGGAMPAELDTFRTSIERYEQGLERIQQILNEIQTMLKEERQGS